MSETIFNSWSIPYHIPAGPGFYVAIGGAVAQYGYSHMMDAIQDHKWNCQIIDHSDDMILLSVQGPHRSVHQIALRVRLLRW